MLVADESRVRELADWTDARCVSVFLPVHQVAGREVGDSLRLKNLLRSAENELVQLGMRPPQATRIIARLTEGELADPSSPVFHRAGIALFAATDLHRTYRLAGDAPTLLTVARRFHLKPLLRMLEHDLRFFVLAVTRGYAQLFLGDSIELRPITVPGMPVSLDDAVLYDDRERAPSRRASRSAESAAVPAFHDQGDRFDHLTEDTMRYLRMVDASLNGVVRKTDPLVLAGSRDVVALYRGLSSHRALVDREVFGNPEVLAVDVLHARASETVAAANDTSTAADVSRFEQLHGTGKASSTPTIVIEAARAGRVDVIFVASDTQLWGCFGAAIDASEIHDARLAGDEDLLDTAAVDAWKTGATVHVVPHAGIPGGTGVAAVFRY